MFNQILKKTRSYIRISAAIMLAVGLWVGMFGICFADSYYTVDTAAIAIASLDFNNSSNIAADSSGNLYIVYKKSVSSYYHILIAKSVDGGQNWTTEQLTTGSFYDQKNATIAIDRNDNIHVAWVGTDASSGGKYRIRYIKKTGDTWGAIEDLTTDNYNKYYPDIAIDSNNNPHIAYSGLSSTDSSYDQIFHIAYNGSSWNAAEKLTATAVDAYRDQDYPSIGIDSSDNIHIVWSGKDKAASTYTQIRYIKYSGSWSAVSNLTSTADTWHKQMPNLTIDFSDYIHVVYQDYQAGAVKDISYLKYNGSWSAPYYISTGSTYTQEYASVSVDPNGIVDVFWDGRLNAGSYSEIRHRQYNGSWGAISSLYADASNDQMIPSAIRSPQAGFSFVWSDSISTDSIKYYVSTDFEPPTYYTPSEISITYPVGSSTSKADYWTIDANTNSDITYDKLYVRVRSASTQACAENTACTSAWVDGNKVIGECDGVDSTFDNTSNVSRLANIPDSMDGETVYATAFLYGVTDATCVDGDGPEVPVLLATSSTISFTYSIDYITDLDNADEYWAGTWADRWGAATSTASYQAVAGGFDVVMGPVVNWASGWSHLFNTADATDAGISAGSGIQILMQHTKDFFNLIPGCQLFAIILIAIIIDIAIYIYKNIYRMKKFFTI